MPSSFQDALNKLVQESAQKPRGNVCRVCHIVSRMDSGDRQALHATLQDKSLTNTQLASVLTDHYDVVINAKIMQRHRANHMGESA